LREHSRINHGFRRDDPQTTQRSRIERSSLPHFLHRSVGFDTALHAIDGIGRLVK
jgi:hypothetical protein